MGDLSPHFSRNEFQCRCCGRLQLDSHLIEGLESSPRPRGVPVVVNAGYRCPRHNQEVGGVPHSEHTRGLAADIPLPGLSLQRCTSSPRRWRNSPRAVLGCTTEIFCTSMCAGIAPAGLG